MREHVSIEEQAVARPTSVMGKMIGVAAIALVGGALVAAMSTKVSGSFVRPAEPSTIVVAATLPTAVLPAAAPVAPPAMAPSPEPALSVANSVRPSAQNAATAARALAAAGAQAPVAQAPVAHVPMAQAPAAPSAHASPRPASTSPVHASVPKGATLLAAGRPTLGKDTTDRKKDVSSKKGKTADAKAIAAPKTGPLARKTPMPKHELHVPAHS